MRNSGKKLIKVLLITIPAIGLAACSTSGRAPVNFLELGSVVAGLPGTAGKTLGDQRNIDRVVARSCAAGILGAGQCDTHSNTSAQRKQELGP